MTGWKAFFEQCGDMTPLRAYLDGAYTNEDLYQAFKARLEAEREREMKNIKYAILETMRYAKYSINSDEYGKIAQMLFPVNASAQEEK